MTKGKMQVEFAETPITDVVVKVVGVGGAGISAVSRMIDEQLAGVEFISIDTDAAALTASKSDVKIQIGKRTTRGLGADTQPRLGLRAIEESREEVRRSLAGADLVLVVAGLGAGTGTGAAPVVAQISREIGALTIGIVTKPFGFEGEKRTRQAEQGISDLRQHVDTAIVIPNERLLSVVGEGIPFRDALKKTDEVLLLAARSISDLTARPGLVNVEFGELRAVLGRGGLAIVGMGVGRGENRAAEAAHQALSDPLLDNSPVRGASVVVLMISGGNDLTLGEVTQISEIVHDAVGDDSEIIFGAVNEPSLHGDVRVTLIAAGFELAADQDGSPQGGEIVPESIQAAIVVAWDPKFVEPEEYETIVALLGELTRVHGGKGLRRIHEEIIDIPVSEQVAI